MKQLAALSLGLVTCALHAQTCQFTANGTVDPWYAFSSATLLKDRSLVTLGTSPASTMGITKWSPDGQVLWNKRIRHIDPSMLMYPQDVEATPEGGMIVGGQLYPFNRYQNICAAKLDSAGTLEWARIFMLDSAEYGTNLGGLLCSLKPADGGYLLTSTCPHGISVSHLDINGVPEWTYRYAGSATNNNGSVGVVGSVIDPGMGYLHYSVSGPYLFVVHTDLNGVPQWTQTYEVGINTVDRAIRAANGDYLFSGMLNGTPAYLMRVDASGTVLWLDQISVVDFSGQQVIELANGHLLQYGQSNTHQLSELDANGTVLADWDMQSPPQGADGLLLPVGGDSVVMAFSVSNGQGSYQPATFISTSTGDLGCLFDAAALTSEQVQSPPSVSDSLVVVRDSLKTWTMAMAEVQNTNELDLSCYGNAGPCVPGFQTTLYGWVQNEQNHTSGPVTVTITFDPTLSYVSAVPDPSSVVGNTATWLLPPLSAYEEGNVFLHLQVPADVGLLGTTLSSTITASQDSVETSLVNNTDVIDQLVVGSYDPNDIEAKPSPYYLLGTDSTVTYTVRFQNTGTASAVNVVVVDTLPAQVDATSLRMEGASHDYTYTLSGNGILAVTFHNIQLPDSNASEPDSHGLFRFSVRPEAGLLPGQEIANRADIFFDFNPAVLTNTALVTVTNETGVPVATKAPTLRLYPVPAQDHLNARLPDDFHASLAWLVGVDGRRMPVQVGALRDGVLPVPVQHLAPGAYVLTVIDAQGHRLAERFVKE